MELAVDERIVGQAADDYQPGFEDLPCMAMIERGGLIVERNALARRMTGFSSSQEDDASVAQPVGDVVLGSFELGDKVRRLRFECLVKRRHGEPIPVHAIAQRVVHHGQECRLLLMLERTVGFGVAVDAGTSVHEASLVEDVLDAAPEASAITHHNRVLHVNREFTRLFGYTACECVGRELRDLVVPDGRLHEREMILHTLRQNGRVAMETVRRTRSGAELDVCVLVAKVRLGSQAMGMLVTYRDIRKQKQEEARLQHSARHDVLTGLPNRSMFLELVGLTLARLRRRPDRSFAVIFLDLDGFKKVNDTLGHAAGDALLLLVAARLTSCLRPQDAVARFGGDEFALLLDESGSAGEVEQVAQRIQVEVQQSMGLGGLGEGSELRVAASMGIAIATPAYESAEEMMIDADAAMYRAKAEGGARHVMCALKETGIDDCQFCSGEGQATAIAKAGC